MFWALIDDKNRYGSRKQERESLERNLLVNCQFETMLYRLISYHDDKALLHDCLTRWN